MANPKASPLPVRVEIAQAFHEEYEATAELYGWKTQEASRVPWSAVPPNQRVLMCHVIGTLEARGIITAGPWLRTASGPTEAGEFRAYDLADRIIRVANEFLRVNTALAGES